MLLLSTGVHSALQHDTIMSSADPDYVLVESEAKRVAESAAKAIRDSRRLFVGSRWGQPTWTGQRGVVGIPKPRYCSECEEIALYKMLFLHVGLAR